MLIRRQTLLLFFLCGWLPAVALACLVFAVTTRERRKQLEEPTHAEAAYTAQRLKTALATRERQIEQLAKDAWLVELPDSTNAATAPATPTPRPMTFVFVDTFTTVYELNGHDLRAVYGFDANRQPLFIAERVTGEDGGYVVKPTQSIPQVTLDDATWAMVAKGAPFGTVVHDGIERHYVPIPKSPRKCILLIADFEIETLVREALTADPSTGDTQKRLVLDQRGRLLNELPGAVRYQPATTVVPDLTRILPDPKSDHPNSGVIFERGAPYFAASQPVGSLGLSVVVMQPEPGFGDKSWWVFLASLVGITVLFLVFARWHQIAVRQDRLALAGLARSAAEIAEGKVTKPVVVEANPAFQKLSANFNLMTEKLREQIAREAEARQFQSFLRLSATITHDLKNAIQALSLLVSNMEAHFDDPQFRAHAIQGLTRSTETLNGLIARLSEPMRSLSGEMPRPQPIDLVPLLRGVLQVTAEQDRAGHELKVDLPDKLIVEVDVERIEKVFENLIINALQALDKQKGTLTVTASAEAEKCTVSISDTGVGMTEEFIRERLFRAFATTKPLGIGLGLYTCREVIRAHGGTITAVSEKGSGTTFRVVLPLRAQALWVT